MDNGGIWFVPFDGEIIFKSLDEDKYHAKIIRNYIKNNNIDIDDYSDKMGYPLSIELLQRGIITFQFEGEYLGCYLPKEISEKQYLWLINNKSKFKRYSSISITYIDEEEKLYSDGYNKCFGEDPYQILNDIIEDKIILKTSNNKHI